MIFIGVVADSVNSLVVVYDGTSVSRANVGYGSAEALSANFTFGVLFRVGVVHRRVFPKSFIGFVMLFSILVPFGISFAAFDGWWRSSKMALHARVATYVMAL